MTEGWGGDNYERDRESPPDGDLSPSTTGYPVAPHCPRCAAAHQVIASMRHSLERYPDRESKLAKLSVMAVIESALLNGPRK